MSDAPEKHHPWSKYYSERGVSRPPIAALRKPPEPEAGRAEEASASPADSGGARARNPPVSKELADAVAAATSGLPGTTAAPFITVMQREVVARELRRHARVRWARRGAIAVLTIVALHFAVTRLFYRAPSDGALDAYAKALARTVLPLHSTPQQPLVIAGAVVTLTDHASANRIRYAAEVNLRLAQPLYVPAVSNGTINYRQMQQSLHIAREKELRFKLFAGKQAPGAPEMPLLIQVAHRAGESVTVRVPFEARRFGWHWRLEPAQLALRTVNRSFDGTTIERYAHVPHLIFGAPGTLADMRLRTQLARAYILAVANQIQRRADHEAIDAFVVDPAIADLPAADAGGPATQQPAGGGPKPIDPDTPAFDPDASAVDPNAPAVQLPPAPTPPG